MTDTAKLADDTNKPADADKTPDANETLQNAVDEAQADIEESTRKQEAYVYAAARAKVGGNDSNPPIDGDERTRTLTIADMNGAPTGIMPGMPGGQNPLAQALAKGDEDVSAAVEQVAAIQAQNDALPDGVQDANEAATTKNAKVDTSAKVDNSATATGASNDPAKDVAKKAPAIPKK